MFLRDTDFIQFLIQNKKVNFDRKAMIISNFFK